MAGPFVRGVAPAYIEQGRVLDVDTVSFTVSVSTMFSKKPQTGITWMTPYQHYANGEGIHAMPEVGSLCWIAFPSDGNRPVILGWAAGVDEEGNWQSRRPEMNPGDVYMGTRDENHIFLKRGGVIQISSTPLCTRLFLPLNNTIRDFCENYALKTLGGDLTWSILREEHKADGRRPATFRLAAKEFANDEEPAAILEVGSQVGDPDAILLLTIFENGSKGAAWKIKLRMDKAGNVTWAVVQDALWTLNGEGGVLIDMKDDVVISSESDLVLSGKTLSATGTDSADLDTNGTMTLKAAQGVKIEGPPTKTLTVAGGTLPVLLATPALLAWLATHTHATAAPGPPSPPMPPLPSIGGDHVSKTIFAR